MRQSLPRPFRLAVDATPLLETRPTGVARYARGLLEAALAASHPVALTLFVPDVPAAHAADFPGPELRGRGAEVVRLGAGPAYRLAHLPGALRRCRPHLFHSFFMAVPPPCGVPVVATAYEVPDASALRAEGCVRTLRQATGWAAARRWAAGLAVISRHTGRAARAAGWAADRPLGWVPPGVPGPRGRRVGRHAAREIIAVGTLRPKKGVELAVAAVARLNERTATGAPVRLTWIGAGVPPRRCAGRARFPGYLADPERDRLIAGAACLIVPSITEGFGLTALEAMAAGCPVVVADAGALPEVVGRGGWVVPRASAESWAEVLGVVLAGGAEVRERVERARRRAAGFTWRRAAARLLALHGRVLSSSKTFSTDVG
ncbi:MAG: glycosyltransferase [Planctomycetes bacterium]|nr:glycosyltransferase [Planctomycetota bacterium]